jgi:hypothetical protein
MVMESGYIYILWNESFPRLIKIGRTGVSVESRVRSLSAATGVPTPFRAVFCLLVSDMIGVEKMIHKELDAYRLKGKEFFSIAVVEAVPLVNRICSNFLCDADGFERHFADIRRLQEKIRENYGEGIEYRRELLNAALEQAVLNENAFVVEMLLDSGADPSYCSRLEDDDSYSYPLLLSAVDTGSIEVVGRLLAAGADVKQESSGSGDTPLFRAVEKSNMELVKILVGYGSNLYHMNKDGVSLCDVVSDAEIRSFLKNFDARTF